MKYFKMVKGEDGKYELVECTMEDLMNSDIIKYDEEGKAVNQVSTEKTKSKVDELTDIVKQLAEREAKDEETGIQKNADNEIKEKVESMEAKLAAYEEAAKKGFAIPRFIDKGTDEDQAKELYTPFDLQKQGMKLKEKVFSNSGHQVTDENREKIADYMILFFKAGYMNDPYAQMELRKRGLEQRESKTALGDSGNTFPVPDIVEEEIFHFARESSIALQDAAVYDMYSESHSWPVESGSATISWGNTTANSDPTITEVQLDCQELSAYTVVRNTTLQDARSDIVSWLTSNMAEAEGLELDNQMFNGTGDPCSGILTAACGYSVVMGSGSTAFSTLGASDLSNMIAQLDGLKKMGAKFYFNGAVLHYVRTLTDDQSRPIFIETVGSPLSGTIYGYRYKEAIKITGTSASNTAFGSFGNLKYFALGRRLASTSLQVDPWGLWTTNRTRFKIYSRWALEIALANGLVRVLTASS